MRKERIARLQRALDRAVCVLLELKRRKGLTRKDREEIDDTVSSLQSLSRQLPTLAFASQKRLVIGVINKFIDLWRRFRGSDH